MKYSPNQVLKIKLKKNIDFSGSLSNSVDEEI